MSIGGISSILDYFDEVNEISWKHDKKFQTLNRNKDFGFYNDATLWTIDWLLERRYNEILKLFVKNREMNVQQTVDELLKDKRYKERIQDLSKKAHYKRIERYIEYLLKWKLIRVSKKERIENLGILSPYYDLSLNGLFYIIFNWGTSDFLYPEFFRDFFKNHSDNILFHLFLLPYFEKTTILESALSNNSRLVINVLFYIKEICESIIQNKRFRYGLLLSGYDNHSNNHILFSWSVEYPQKDSYFYTQFNNEKGGLREFLITELGWKWVNDAQIFVDHNDRRIMINGTNPDFKAYIFVDPEKKKAYLRYGKVKYNLIMKEETYWEFYCQYKNEKNI